MAKADKIVLPEGTNVPNHIALICDGNRRWARARGLHTLLGHKAGFDAAKALAKSARDMGVHTMTAWIFSTENWDRSAEEIAYLMDLYRQFVKEARRDAPKEGIRIVHLGRKDRIPADLAKLLEDVEKETRNNKKHVLNVALDYGGRDEIVRAVNKVLSDKVSEIGVEEFEKYLDTGDQPFPYVDLFIRTSGEQRTSGLLPWQMHYAEYFWEIEHLPDFTPEKLKEAVLDYSRRRRRFGGNDAEEHLKFDPKLVAGLEIAYKKKLNRDDVIRYVKEQYGLSKQLALEAGAHMYNALRHGEQKEWKSAKKALTGLYEVVKRNLGLAFEPEIIANFEVDLWKDGASEAKYREYFAEKFRVSEFQAAKSAHLAFLAQGEIAKKNFEGARGYLEKFYKALKERVA